MRFSAHKVSAPLGCGLSITDCAEVTPITEVKLRVQVSVGPLGVFRAACAEVPHIIATTCHTLAQLVRSPSKSD